MTELVTLALALAVLVGTVLILWRGVPDFGENGSWHWQGNYSDIQIMLWDAGSMACNRLIDFMNLFPWLFHIFKPFIYVSSTVGFLLAGFRARADLSAMKFDKVVNFSLNYIVPVEIGGDGKPVDLSSGARMGRAEHAIASTAGSRDKDLARRRSTSRASTSRGMSPDLRSRSKSQRSQTKAWSHSAYRYDEPGRKSMKKVRDYILQRASADRPTSGTVQSPSDIAEIVREVFTSLDEDQRGYLTHEEFAKSVSGMDLKLTEGQIHNLLNVMKGVDSQQDMTIDFDEFKAMFELEGEGSSREKKQLRFRTLMEISIDSIMYENRAAVKAVMTAAKRTAKAHMFVGMPPHLITTPNEILSVQKEISELQRKVEAVTREGGARDVEGESELAQACAKLKRFEEQFQELQQRRNARADDMLKLERMRKNPLADSTSAQQRTERGEEERVLERAIADKEEGVAESLAVWDNTERNWCGCQRKMARASAKLKRSFVRKYPRVGNGIMWVTGHPELNESDFKLLMANIMNRLSEKYSEGYFDFDQELPVVFKKYVFGITYEQDVPATVAKKLRVMMASVEFLETICDMQEPTFEFTSHKPRWSTLKEMARLYREKSKFKKGSFIPTLFEIKIWRAYPALALEEWVMHHWMPHRHTMLDSMSASGSTSSEWVESSRDRDRNGDSGERLPWNPDAARSPDGHGGFNRQSSRGSCNSTGCDSTESSGIVRISSRGSEGVSEGSEHATTASQASQESSGPSPEGERPTSTLGERPTSTLAMGETHTLRFRNNRPLSPKGF